MVFSSITFLFYFLPLFLAFYFLSEKQPYKIAVIFIFSLIFYAWGEPLYIILMVISIFVNWLLALLIDRHNGLRLFYLYVAIIFNLGVLCFFKYSSFIVGNIQSLFGFKVPYYDHMRHLPLPVGISFYTFQALSYVIDVYRGKFSSENNPVILGTYISMFPQLIAGPIVRYEQIRQQIHNINIRFDDILIGARLFIIGLASKVLLANYFAGIADYYFDQESSFHALSGAWIGAFSYFFQIYFDFNGYSVMAIGLGRIMGFTFSRNFDRPYIALSITDFWRRWHISLSTWFRDYLYIPLGGNRKSKLITFRNLMLVFLLCGFWHGAGWNFLIWGLYHGCFLIFERINDINIISIPTILKRFYALSVVIIGWVIFRCESYSQLQGYLLSMVGVSEFPAHSYKEIHFGIWLCFAVVGTVCSLVKFDYDNPPLSSYKLSYIIYLITFVLCVTFLICGTYNPFIYYRF